jgi:hypothetical protein
MIDFYTLLRLISSNHLSNPDQRREKKRNKIGKNDEEKRKRKKNRQK